MPDLASAQKKTFQNCYSTTTVIGWMFSVTQTSASVHWRMSVFLTGDSMLLWWARNTVKVGYVFQLRRYTSCKDDSFLTWWQHSSTRLLWSAIKKLLWQLFYGMHAIRVSQPVSSMLMQKERCNYESQVILNCRGILQLLVESMSFSYFNFCLTSQFF